MKWFSNRFQREGAGRPAPSTGWPRAGVMAMTHFWKLVAVNLLFVVFSLPVFTLPAALTALNRVCVIIYKEGNIFLFTEFWKEFKRSFWRTMLPALGFGVLLFGGYFFMSLANGNLQLGFVAVVFFALGMLMVAVAVLVGEYFFVVIAVLDISVVNGLKNAFLLSISKPVYSIGTLLLVAFLAVALAALMPLIGSVLLVLIWVSLTQYPICFMVYDITEDLVLIPYENQKQAQASEDSDNT